VFSCRNQDVVDLAISEYYHIGDSSTGRFHWILTGSSSDLRTLVTGKHDAEDTFKYPSYRGTDLNSSKFRFSSICPFVDTNDFLGYLQFEGINATDIPLLKIYLTSGGQGR
jgi:hypothetical protein